MNTIMQAVLTFAIVGIAVGYTLVRFMPKPWRSATASWTAASTKRLGFSDDVARRVEAKLSSGGACGSCDSCNACAKPPMTEDAEAACVVPSPPRYRSIPIRRASH